MAFIDTEEDHDLDSAQGSTSEGFGYPIFSRGSLSGVGAATGASEKPKPDAEDGSTMSIGNRIVGLTPQWQQPGSGQDESGAPTARVPDASVQPPRSQTAAGDPFAGGTAGRTPNDGTSSGGVVDLTPQIRARSRIPKPSAVPDPQPPRLTPDTAAQDRTLSRLARSMRSEPPLGVLPSGTLVRDLTYLQRAPERILRQYESGNNFSNVNTKAIVTNEGGSQVNGYVPRAKGGSDHSGVTIAGGFDLGQHNLAELRSLGLPEDITKQISQYVGLKGQAARDAITKAPLKITAAQAAQIDQAVLHDKLDAAGAAFNRQTKKAGAFSSLPWRAQTAIADLWYNMGDLSKAAPNLWKQVTTGDWEGAYRNLKNFNTKDQTLARRAQKNAGLLRNAIDSGSLD